MKALSRLLLGRFSSYVALAAGVFLSCLQLSARNNDHFQDLSGNQTDSIHTVLEDSLHVHTPAVDAVPANADLPVEDSVLVEPDGPEEQAYAGDDMVYSEVERRGKNFYMNDILLEQTDLEPLLAATPYSYQDIEKYRHGFAVGKGLLIGFGSLAGVGLVTTGVGVIGLTIEALTAGIGTAFMVPLFAMTGDAEAGVVPFDAKFAPVASIGAIMLCTGALGLVAGTTVFCVYKARLNKVEKAINASPAQSVNLSFGTQMHGIGFALNF